MVVCYHYNMSAFRIASLPIPYNYVENVFVPYIWGVICCVYNHWKVETKRSVHVFNNYTMEGGGDEEVERCNIL